MSGSERARVVVGADGSPTGHAAVQWGAEAAERLGQTLHLVHALAWVTPPYYLAGHLSGGFAEPYTDELRAAAQSMLADLAGQVRAAHPALAVTTELVIGSAAQVLVEASQSATMIAVGSRGLGGFAGLVVGSVGTQLAGHAACPVVVLHGDRPATTGRVVLGVDPPGESDAAIEFAFGEAARRDAGLTVVHAWASPPSSGFGADAPRTYDPAAITAQITDTLADRLTPWADKHPTVRVRTLVQHGRPVDALLSAAEDADLLVVGSHGHGALHDLVLGSVSNTALHSARCAVAIVPTRRRAPKQQHAE